MLLNTIEQPLRSSTKTSLLSLVSRNQHEKEYLQHRGNLQSEMLMNMKAKFRANAKAEPLILGSFNWFQSQKKYFSKRELNLAATQG